MTTTLTWWVNGRSAVRHATTGGPETICGAGLHRDARQSTPGSPATRECQRCRARLTEETR